MKKAKRSNIKYPNGKDFIFSIFDDTDVSTLEYIKPIYDFLYGIDIKITKSVWPISYAGKSDYLGSNTLEEKEYAEYVKTLSDRGFEIGYHGPTMVSSIRQDVIKSFQVFFDVLGHYPRIYAPHSTNRENLYWGTSRFSNPIIMKLFQLLSHDEKGYYQGHVKGSPFFWGDLSLKYIDYVRNFTFEDINLLNVGYCLPYSNTKQKYVKSFYFTSDADNVEEFNQILKEKNQEKLEKERGVCIISTHFGKGFVGKGGLNEKTKELLQHIRKRNGWFVPVSSALDFLKNENIKNKKDDQSYDLSGLELKWFIHSFRRGINRKKYYKTEVAYLGKLGK